MGKDKSEKKDKKEKKAKLTEVNGVSKKSKKDKKEKKEKRKSDVTEALEAELDSESSPAPVQTVIRTKVVDEDGDAEMSDAEAPVAVVGAVVPFANPLADEKQAKKVMKSVKKGMFLFFFRWDWREVSCAGRSIFFTHSLTHLFT